ncbi:MAG: hypothetical protein KF819_17865 [Labilithrix sp.]|nr:hypothetical protein [Labilithrix sp.]
MRLSVLVHPRGQRLTVAEQRASGTLKESLEPLARFIHALAIRYDEIVDRFGDAEIVCRAKVTVAGIPDAPAFVVEGRGRQYHEAAELAADAVKLAMRRTLERALPRTRKERDAKRLLDALREHEPPVAQAKPDAREVDAAAGDHRATPPDRPRRRRHAHLTLRQSRATSVREISKGPRPSRKSTRKAANRSKRDSNQARRQTREVRSPKARSARARAR